MINRSEKTDSTFPPTLSVQTGTMQIAVLSALLVKSKVSFEPLYSNKLWGSVLQYQPRLFREFTEKIV